MLTQHCSAVSGMVAPSSIVDTIRARKSSEYGFAIHTGLLPARSLNHIRAGMGIPSDSVFSGNALSRSFRVDADGQRRVAYCASPLSLALSARKAARMAAPLGMSFAQASATGSAA